MRFLLCSLRGALVVGSLAGISAGILFVSPVRAAEADPAVVPGVLVQADTPQYNWAKLHARARIAYVSSGPKLLAVRMIDDDLGTAFRFAGNDTSPVVIVELAESQRLHRVSAVFTPEVARLDIYLLNERPKDPAALEYLTPFASIVDPPEPGNATVDFAPSNARYVALRWIRLKTRRPFDVAQVSAFSFVPVNSGYFTLPSVEAAGLPQIAVVSPL